MLFNDSYKWKWKEINCFFFHLKCVLLKVKKVNLMVVLIKNKHLYHYVENTDVGADCHKWKCSRWKTG